MVLFVSARRLRGLVQQNTNHYKYPLPEIQDINQNKCNKNENNWRVNKEKYDGVENIMHLLIGKNYLLRYTKLSIKIPVIIIIKDFRYCSNTNKE